MLRTSLLMLVVGISIAVRSPQGTAIQKELDRLHIPDKLVPKDKQPLFILRGEGTQTYTGEEKDGKLQWSGSSPKAVLLDYRTGEQVGTHSKGPTWVDDAGSKLTGTLIEKDPSPNANAIPWLLLGAKSENGGRFAKVTNIQRVDTWGGMVGPAAPTKVGETKEVRYEATYVFLGDK
jgi:hypothetical protein